MEGSFITKLYNFFRGFFVVGGSHSAEAVKLTATGTGTKVTFSLRFRSSAKKTPLLVSSDWMLKILLNSFYYLYKLILSGKIFLFSEYKSAAAFMKCEKLLEFWIHFI